MLLRHLVEDTKVSFNRSRFAFPAFAPVLFFVVSIPNMPRLARSQDTEYVRGKIEERNDAPTGKFDARGNDVWAWRSGRTYAGEVDGEGGARRDYSSPVTGNGRPRGGLSALTRRRSPSPSDDEDETEYMPIGRGKLHITHGGASVGAGKLHITHGGGTPDYDTTELMAVGARRNRGGAREVGAAKPRRSNPGAKARGALVSKLMREKGMSLGEASKHIKTHGLM